MMLESSNPEALSMLYDKYASVLLGLITRMVGDEEQAECVLQKTFVSIWLQRSQFPASNLSLYSWVILLARDAAKTFLKTEKPQSFSKTAENSTFVLSADRTSLEVPPVPPKESNFICHLEPHDKTALDLVYLKGCTCEEAAAILNISVDELKISLKKAIKQLGADKAA